MSKWTSSTNPDSRWRVSLKCWPMANSINKLSTPEASRRILIASLAATMLGIITLEMVELQDLKSICTTMSQLSWAKSIWMTALKVVQTVKKHLKISKATRPPSKELTRMLRSGLLPIDIIRWAKNTNITRTKRLMNIRAQAISNFTMTTQLTKITRRMNSPKGSHSGLLTIADWMLKRINSWSNRSPSSLSSSSNCLRACLPQWSLMAANH